MSQKPSKYSSREAIVSAARQLFAARGYTSVTLKDIATQIGIKQASLYYHLPSGKDDLSVIFFCAFT